MQEKARRYNFRFIVLVALILVGLSVTNLLVDPYGIYPATSLDALSEFRDPSASRVRKSKTLVDGDFDVVILGSSRANGGIKVDDAVFGNAKVYNGALPGTSMTEVLRVAEVAFETQRDLGEVILFADFFMFNDSRQPAGDFAVSLFSPSSNAAEFHLDKMLSESTLARSREVIEHWRRNEKRGKSGSGSNQEDVVGFFLRKYRFGKKMYGDFVVRGQSRASYQSLVAKIRQHDVKLTVVVLPIHAVLLEAVAEAGLWEIWEDWKRNLVADLGSQGSLWDFQVYSDFTTTRIAEADDPRAALTWFRDPSHASVEFCSNILHVAYGQAPSLSGVSQAGQKLSVDTLEAWLASVREKRRQYIETHPKEIEFVREILAKGPLDER